LRRFLITEPIRFPHFSFVVRTVPAASAAGNFRSSSAPQGALPGQNRGKSRCTARILRKFYRRGRTKPKTGPYGQAKTAARARRR